MEIEHTEQFFSFAFLQVGDPVAQWLARRIADREVSGSNPSSHK